LIHAYNLIVAIIISFDGFLLLIVNIFLVSYVTISETNKLELVLPKSKTMIALIIRLKIIMKRILY